MKAFFRGLVVVGSSALLLQTVGGCAACGDPPEVPVRRPNTSQPHQGPGSGQDKYFAPGEAGEAPPLER
ncbi:MAG TPA: hypothetical protein VKB65_01315 [Myxococcota bacterium]|nr:hypothetical protein [Myxococcota bacterium]